MSVYHIFINSKNRENGEKVCNFNIYLKNQIMTGRNQIININVASFSMLNSMYNINSKTLNNQFTLRKETIEEVIEDTTITIPFGNYSVLTLKTALNSLLSNHISVSYNLETNSYTFKKIDNTYKLSIIPLKCSKILGITAITEITSGGHSGSFVDMVNYQQIILKCPSLNFVSFSQDNITDKNNFLGVSDILFWINKQDVEPFQTINYQNEDCGTLYCYNLANEDISILNLQLINENNEYIEDANDYLLQLQITVSDKNESFYKDMTSRILAKLTDISFTLLNILFSKNKMLC